MSDKIHLISESLTDFSVLDNLGNSVSVTTEEPLALDKPKSVAVACNNGVSFQDDGKTQTGRIDGVVFQADGVLGRSGSQEPMKLPKAMSDMGTLEQLASGVKLLVTGHVSFDLGNETSPLQTMCDAMRKQADNGPSR